MLRGMFCNLRTVPLPELGTRPRGMAFSPHTPHAVRALAEADLSRLYAAVQRIVTRYTHHHSRPRPSLQCAGERPNGHRVRLPTLLGAFVVALAGFTVSGAVLCTEVILIKFNLS